MSTLTEVKAESPRTGSKEVDPTLDWCWGKSKSAPEPARFRVQYGQVMRYSWDCVQKANSGRAASGF